MLNFIIPSDKSGLVDMERLSEKMISVFALFSMFTGSAYALYDYIFSEYILLFIDSGTIAIFLGIYLINKRRHYKTAKIILFAFSNTFLFCYTDILPRDFGNYFYFFPLMAMSYLLFQNKQEREIRLLFIFMPTIFLIILELFDYNVFGNIQIIDSSYGADSYTLNMFISFLFLGLTITYLFHINQSIKDRLLKSNKELELFFYRTSHDLKAPLSTTTGLLNLAHMTNNTDEIKQYLSHITGSIEQLNNLLNDLIEITKVRSGEVVKQKVSLVQLINETTEMEGDILSGKVAIIKDLEVKYVLADPSYLRLVFRNLINNAIKYRRNIPAPQIIIRTEKTSDHGTIIVVEDNGIGIDTEATDHIFDMFFRGTDKIKTGVGLGLFIVKNAIEKMGGDIKVESVPDEGTRFIINLRQ